MVQFAQGTKKEAISVKENGVTKVFLFRHAEKGNDGTNNSDLTFKGEERAKKIALMLEDFDIDKFMPLLL
ncbi:MAG: hypothetical protein HC854_09925 [Flavobacterium sp.]|nr:hypothetical protein [Flavobacterium sp.]